MTRGLPGLSRVLSFSDGGQRTQDIDALLLGPPIHDLVSAGVPVRCTFW
jgi:hypothetical protein